LRNMCLQAIDAVKHGVADASSMLYGEARSLFKGVGLEYVDHRPYMYGDDARHVDWRLSARRLTNPYSVDLVVREYVSERRVRSLHILDLHDSLLYWDKLWILVYCLTMILHLAHRLSDETILLIASGRGLWIAPTMKPLEVIEYVKNRICVEKSGYGESGLERASRTVSRLSGLRSIMIYTDYATKPQYISVLGDIGKTLNTGIGVVIASNNYEINPPPYRLRLTLKTPGGETVVGDVDKIYSEINKHVGEFRTRTILTTRNYIEINSIEWLKTNKYKILTLYLNTRTKTPTNP